MQRPRAIGRLATRPAAPPVRLDRLRAEHESGRAPGTAGGSGIGVSSNDTEAPSFAMVAAPTANMLLVIDTAISVRCNDESKIKPVPSDQNTLVVGDVPSTRPRLLTAYRQLESRSAY